MKGKVCYRCSKVNKSWLTYGNKLAKLIVLPFHRRASVGIKGHRWASVGIKGHWSIEGIEVVEVLKALKYWRFWSIEGIKGLEVMKALKAFINSPKLKMGHSQLNDFYWQLINCKWKSFWALWTQCREKYFLSGVYPIFEKFFFEFAIF